MVEKRIPERKSPQRQCTEQETASGNKAARVKPPRSRRKKPWTHVHCMVFLLGVALLLFCFLGTLLHLYVKLDIPAIRTVESYQPKQTSVLVDSDGRVIERIFEENRLVVRLEDMPQFLPNAFIAAEDDRFYQHPGIDFWSVLRAFVHNIRAGARAQGGSTITQQVTRSLLLSREKSYVRKIKEAILAYRIDNLLSKDEILYIYLNQIYLGEGCYGVGAAAQRYFDKTPAELTLAQMALLAGLPQAPSRYSPLRNLKLARMRQVYVLNRMAEEGYITAEQARQAHAQPLDLTPEIDAAVEAGYFSQYVQKYVVGKYGREQLLTGGLVIHTTLDSSMQKAAVAAIDHGIGLPKNDSSARQGALVAIEVGSGRVRALVGGSDFTYSQFDRATQARRQPGSAMKPLIYATAFENGLTPETVFEDAPLSLKAGRGKIWRPRNFDKRHRGNMTLREALIHSNNVVSVKLLRQTGIEKAVELARKLGIQSNISADLSLALGSSDLSLLELTAAYGAFADQGMYSAPLFIEKIVERKSGRVIEQNMVDSRQVLSHRTARWIDDILTDVIRQGTGRRARGLTQRSAGKTGTTDRNMDAWFVGYTPGLVAGVWVGHDRKISMGRGATGGSVAAPIWLDFMKKATGPVDSDQ